MPITRIRGGATARLSLSVATVLVAAPAMAFQIDTGDRDTKLAWDTTVRYNAGWRMEDPNPHFANAFGSDETEGRFKKRDLVTNRVDLFSELDYSTRREDNTYGFRVSAALWSENAYSSTSRTGDLINSTFPGAFAVPSNYGPGAEYSRYAKRYVTGSSGEFVDAFAFGSFALGDTLLSVKLGQHNVYWGEAMFTVADGVAAGQGPIDTIKAATSPGAEAKELFMPINQLTANWSLSDSMALMMQYTFDWKPYRGVSGGTFFSASDAAGNLLGSDPMCASVAPAGTCIRSLDAVTPGRSGGDFGLALRLTPSWLENGSAGLYYRKYDEKLPWSSIQLAGGIAAFTATGPSPTNLGLRLAYARNTEMFGVSLNQNFYSVSTGIEVSYRRNTALNSVGGFFAGSQGISGLTQLGPTTFVPNFFLSSAANIPLAQTPGYEQVEGARGNTFHAVLNGVFLLSKTALWETGNAQFEFAYQRLDKVTKNAGVYYSVDHACKVGYLAGGIVGGVRNKSDGCATKDSLAFNLGFNPQWMAVLPSVDLTMPISYSYGIFGNSPTLGGSYEKAYSWSIGLKALYQNRYEFGVALSDKYQDYKTATATAANGVPGQAVFSTGNGSTQVQNSHRWLSLRFKTTF